VWASYPKEMRYFGYFYIYFTAMQYMQIKIIIINYLFILCSRGYIRIQIQETCFIIGIAVLVATN